MDHPFEQQLAQSWPIEDWSDLTILLAISGGPDSMALLRSVSSLQPLTSSRVVIAHFNHRLRGDDSHADARFVREQASAAGFDYVEGSRTDGEGRQPATGGVQGSPDPQHVSESSAREARYAFLTDTARAQGARYVLTAHTADDQVETILHRILRGTGLSGLAGIPRARTLAPGIALLRPLLWATRQQIVAYLEAIRQPYRIDRSNDDSRYTRNRLRNELLPLLEENYNPRVREALLRLAEQAGEAQRLSSGCAEQLALAAILEQSADSVTLHAATLAAANPYVLRELFLRLWREHSWPLQAMTAEHWKSVEQLAQTPAAIPDQRTLPGGVHASRTADALRLVAQSLRDW